MGCCRPSKITKRTSIAVVHQQQEQVESKPLSRQVCIGVADAAIKRLPPLDGKYLYSFDLHRMKLARGEKHSSSVVIVSFAQTLPDVGGKTVLLWREALADIWPQCYYDMSAVIPDEESERAKALGYYSKLIGIPIAWDANDSTAFSGIESVKSMVTLPPAYALECTIKDVRVGIATRSIPPQVHYLIGYSDPVLHGGDIQLKSTLLLIHRGVMENMHAGDRFVFYGNENGCFSEAIAVTPSCPAQFVLSELKLKY